MKRIETHELRNMLGNEKLSDELTREDALVLKKMIRQEVLKNILIALVPAILLVLLGLKIKNPMVLMPILMLGVFVYEKTKIIRKGPIAKKYTTIRKKYTRKENKKLKYYVDLTFSKKRYIEQTECSKKMYNKLSENNKVVLLMFADKKVYIMPSGNEVM